MFGEKLGAAIMNEDRPLFILAGNGPYENRGCEAIVRGTVKILREHFENPRFICLSHFQSKEQFMKQRLKETDDAIVHLASHRLNKKKIIRNFWRPNIWDAVYQNFFNRDAFYRRVYRDMLPYLHETAAVLSVGGDNYSLDYGIPTLFTALDNLVLGHRRSIVLWGASVGPFSTMPDYERYMGGHLQKVTGIFARESATVEYLESIGVIGNVHSVADPAFLMDAMQPKEKMSIDQGAIGLNFSPLMADFVTGGDLERWTKIVAEIIAEVARITESQIYLIPHVTNDNAFMQRALSLIPGENEKITLVPTSCNAAETKWIISRMELFAGARTHSTIAALSSGVPTLSFAYSIKAQGINRDIFGHADYCLGPTDLNAEVVSCRILSMLGETTAIRRDLTKRIPEVQRAALNAGMDLKRLIREI
jgi:polysaccharide pyruvyl transferase WcaK-like protein